MTRLFDAASALSAKEKAKREREEVRQRAEEADRALAEIEELDEQSIKLKEALAKAASVTPIVYEQFRKPGSKWLIEHARVGDDYVYQVFPLKPPLHDWADVFTMMAAALHPIYPDTVKLHFWPPSENAVRPFYTIRAEKVALLPGWEEPVRNRALQSLAAVPAWGDSGLVSSQ